MISEGTIDCNNIFGSQNVLKKRPHVSEEVIKRRLLIDGDGTGDDRRLNLLLRSFIKWSNSPTSPDDNT
jgi:hypothetical protein